MIATWTTDELVNGIRERKEKALTILCEQYGNALSIAIRKIIKNDEAAEEALQNTFLKVWINIDHFNSNKGRLFSWMVTIARNEALDAYRSQAQQFERRTKRFDNDEGRWLDDPLKKVDLIGLYQLLLFLLPRDRAIMELTCFRGFTCEETARLIGIPSGTVKTRMKKCYLQLRSHIQ